MLVEEQTVDLASYTGEDRETPSASRDPGEGPHLEEKEKMTGTHLLTATLADGRRGTVLRLATMLLISFAVALALASVAQGQETAPAESHVEAVADSPRDGSITVVVDNQNWSDLRVYALVSGVRYRLGTAYTFRPVEFEIPRHLQTDVKGLELVAFPIGGSGLHRSGSVLVNPGDVVQWTVQNRPGFSTVF